MVVLRRGSGENWEMKPEVGLVQVRVDHECPGEELGLYSGGLIVFLSRRVKWGKVQGQGRTQGREAPRYMHTTALTFACLIHTPPAILFTIFFPFGFTCLSTSKNTVRTTQHCKVLDPIVWSLLRWEVSNAAPSGSLQSSPGGRGSVIQCPS